MAGKRGARRRRSSMRGTPPPRPDRLRLPGRYMNTDYRRASSWGAFNQYGHGRFTPRARAPGKPRRAINRVRARRDTRGRFT